MQGLSWKPARSRVRRPRRIEPNLANFSDENGGDPGVYGRKGIQNRKSDWPRPSSRHPFHGGLLPDPTNRFQGGKRLSEQRVGGAAHLVVLFFAPALETIEREQVSFTALVVLNAIAGRVVARPAVLNRCLHWQG
jgi:hypothetical protein